MKRVGGIFEAVAEPSNLELAFWKASRGKCARADQREFAANLGEELAKLRAGLLDGTYPVGEYRRFTVYEPKERVICAAAFRERVLHHALMNVLEPWIEKWLVFDTYACRKGKGQLAAVRRAQSFARKYGWFLKCDVRKFFDSIPHEGVEGMLERKIKDRRAAAWLMKIVDTYETTPGRGLPIGNLTSQHLANLYLDRLDRLFAAAPGPRRGYVRYMDDFACWSDDKAFLLKMRDAAADFLRRELGLELKEAPFVNRSAHGMDFLGMRVYPGRVRAARASLDRFKRKSRLYDRLLAEGVWSESLYQERMTALTAFLQQADTLGWRRKASGSNRVQRGGSWNNNARNCRSANRDNDNPSNDNDNNGFRLCCSAAPQEPESPAVHGAARLGKTDEHPRPRAASRQNAERRAGLLPEQVAVRASAGETDFNGKRFYGTSFSMASTESYRDKLRLASRSRMADRVVSLGVSPSSSRTIGETKPRCSRVCMRRMFMAVDVVMPRRAKRSSARRLISGLTRKAIVDVAMSDAPFCLTDARSVSRLPHGCKR